MNDKKIESPDKITLDKYREKVVDFEFEVESAIHELTETLFRAEEREVITKFINKSNLTNIRVIEKTSLNIAYFRKLLKEYNESLYREILHHILVLSYIYYESGNDTILKDVISSHFYEEKEHSPESKYYIELSQKLDYFKREYDRYICDYITKRKIDEESFLIEIKTLSENFTRSSAESTLKELWDLFRSNFIADDNAIIHEFSKFLDENYINLPYSDIVNAQTFIDIIKPSNHNNWSKLYIERNIENKNKKELTYMYDDIEDIELKIRVISLIQEESNNSSPSLDFYINRITSSRNYNEKAYDFMASLTEDEYYSWMKNSESRGVIDKINRVIYILKPEQSIYSDTIILEKIHRALYKLSMESVLNKQRILKFIGEKYTLNPDEKPSPL